MGASATGKDKEQVAVMAAALMDELVGLADAEVTSRSMFGGVGIFADDIMFAMVTSAGQPCLRTSEETEDEFEAYGSERFHERMPYHTIPPNILANHGELRAWAGKALAVARAAKKPKKAAKPKK